jgi:uncharacterized membrane protein YjgN (DUF898 family)
MENNTPITPITPVYASGTTSSDLSPVRKIIFHGKGSTLFGIYIVNILLSIITLGLYYPWAKAALAKYTYSETEFEGSRFTFHGTGKEMFIGMLKALVLVGFVVGCFYLLIWLGLEAFAIVFYMLIIGFITPLAIVGSLKYRTSRSSWRGIHFGYRGTYNSMMKVCVKGTLLSIVTMGFYGSWFIVDVYKEVFSNLRVGTLQFKFKGDGASYFGINLGGYMLTLITLGIYAFKWQSNMHNFTTNSIELVQDEKRGSFQASTTGWGIFQLMFVNMLILVFSLGLATPWALVRSINYYMDNTVIKGAIDFDAITQSETYTKGAMGEGLMDSLDIQMV